MPSWHLAVAAALLLGCRSLTAVAAAPSPLLHELFADHAVLQRDQPIDVFGEAHPGEKISVSMDAHAAEARADASGRWHARLPALPAGGPHTLLARSESGREEQRSDLLVGDVYLCSGQSNMEFPVAESLTGARSVREAKSPLIRLLHIPHAISPTALGHFKDDVAWQTVSPDTLGDFSAVCYYFARELARREQVPLGLIQSTWGGSRIEPWISAEGLGRLGGYADRLKLLAAYAHDAPRAERTLANHWQHWWQTQSGSAATPWTDVSGAGWQAVPLPMRDWKTWGVPELARHDGMMWFRRRFTLDSSQAGGPAKVSIGAIDEVDQTWLNGRPLGNTFGYATERTYDVPAGVLKAGENLLMINVLSAWDAGGMYGPPEHLVLEPAQRPALSLAGDWQYHTVPESMGYPPRAPWESVSGLAGMYNAMIAPLTHLTLRGVLWYQGESNAGEAAAYREQLAVLLGDWRGHFDQDLPFLIVQLPNFGALRYAPAESDWASLREAQRRAVLADHRAALIVTIDTGEAQELHPPNKLVVGQRLAGAARHLVYGDAASASGPMVLNAHRDQGWVQVDFADTGKPLQTIGGPVLSFELCGKDPGSCRYVTGQLSGSRISLTADAGPAERVRYCWADAPLCNLYDDSGLPATPFQVDVQ